MSEAAAPSAPPRRGARRPWRRLAIAAAVLLLLLLLAAVTLILLRGPLAGWFAREYLRRQGVPAAITVERVDLDGVAGRLRLGDPAAPDLVVRRFEATFEPLPVWKRRGLAPRIASIRLTEPVLRARWDGARLTFGRLQPLIDGRRPDSSGEPGPRVIVERGRVALATPYGPALVTADAAVDDGRLLRLEARAAPARLRGPGWSAAVDALVVNASSDGAGLWLDARAQLRHADGGAATADGVRLHLAGRAPYGLKDQPLLQGRFAGVLEAAAQELRAGGDAARRSEAATLRLALSGRVSAAGRRISLAGEGTARAASANGGGLRLQQPAMGLALEPTTLTLGAAPAAAGRGRLTLTAAAGAAAGATIWRLSARAEAQALSWTPQGWRWRGAARADAAAVRSGELALTATSLRASGEAGATGGAVFARLALAGEAVGALPPALIRTVAEAPPDIAAGPAQRAALRDLLTGGRLTVPAARLTLAGDRLRLALPQPATWRGRRGVLTLAGVGDAPVFDTRGAGAATLAVSGEALPQATLRLADLRLGPVGASARLTLDLRHTGGLLEQLTLRTAGPATLADGRLRFRAAACAPVTLAGYQVGETRVEGARLSLCPAAAPTLEIGGDGAWRLEARVAEGAARITPLLVRLERVEGPLSLRGGGADKLNGAAPALRATVVDAEPAPRFAPLDVTAAAVIRRDVLTGEGRAADPAGRKVADLTVRHDLATGVGAAAAEARLVFAPDGLQPQALVPPLGAVLSEVSGPAAATARFSWAPEGAAVPPLASSGALRLDGVDANTPAGRLTGVRGTLDLASLTPVQTAAPQTLTAAGLQTVTGLTDLTVTVALSETAATLSARARAGQGTILVDDLTAPLAPGAPLSGRLRLDDLDLGALIGGTSLADKLKLNVVVDADLPLRLEGETLRITNGRLNAVAPGRLSLDPSAFATETTGGAVAGQAPPPSLLQNLTQQALRDLAFDSLEATVNSREDGRLGVVFKIAGRHDPAAATPPFRVPAAELLNGAWTERDVPLPKGTPVNLTLDSTLNFDELLAAYRSLAVENFRAQFGQQPAPAGGSAGVQPSPPREDGTRR